MQRTLSNGALSNNSRLSNHLLAFMGFAKLASLVFNSSPENLELAVCSNM